MAHRSELHQPGASSKSELSHPAAFKFVLVVSKSREHIRPVQRLHPPGFLKDSGFAMVVLDLEEPSWKNRGKCLNCTGTGFRNPAGLCGPASAASRRP